MIQQNKSASKKLIIVKCNYYNEKKFNMRFNYFFIKAETELMQEKLQLIIRKKIIILAQKK